MTCPDLKSPIQTYSPSGKCEQCAVRKLKESHPFTWNIGVGVKWSDIVNQSAT